MYIELYVGIFYTLIFILGCVFGSFLNLVADRSVNGEPILIGRSKCDHCNEKLGSRNLIPVISYLIQKGKCAFCKKGLSFSYPLSELLTGFAFVFAAYHTQFFGAFTYVNGLSFLYLATVLCFYIILFLADAKYRLLPDKVMFPAIFFVLFCILLFSSIDLKVFYDKLNSDTMGKYLLQVGFFKNHLFFTFKNILLLLGSSFGLAFFFLALIIITKGRGMGGGDVKLAFLIGLFNGFPNNILAIFLGFFFGAIYSLILIAVRKKKVKDAIPFGPFLIAGSLVAFIWGTGLIKWYLGLF